MKKETNFTFLFYSFLLYFIFYCYRSSSKENEMLYYLPWIINISSHLEVFCKKSVLKNVAKFPGKHLCQSLFFIQFQNSNWNFFKRRDSLTGFFLWIIHLLLAASDCFWMFLCGKKKIKSLKKSISTWRNTTKKNLWYSRIWK